MMLSTSGLYNVDDGMITEYRVVSKMKIGGANQNTQRKPAPLPPCPPHIPHDLIWD
jgi:hypothetical protein